MAESTSAREANWVLGSSIIDMTVWKKDASISGKYRVLYCLQQKSFVELPRPELVVKLSSNPLVSSSKVTYGTGPDSYEDSKRIQILDSTVMIRFLSSQQFFNSPEFQMIQPTECHNMILLVERPSCKQSMTGEADNNIISVRWSTGW
ncbi:hypothetical protein Tco_0626899 [Tanacetum coccineum]|uniref:Uncharacterized protein n=1 Tax=Tanacetum coccineum TaxID=301880 RepID=A0ABQ4WKV0_9ASTR